MKSFLTFALILRLTTAFPSNQIHPFSDEYIAQINSKQSTWKAGRNFGIDDYELFKVLASGVKPKNASRVIKTVIHDEDEDVPESFDSREAWPECADIIGIIRDQGRCGSCWAFAAVEAMSDRICIHSNGAKKLMVSSQDLLTCGTSGDCGGGWPDMAWEDWTSGIVTGGLYNHLDQGCKSYFLPNCEDNLNNCTEYVDTPPCIRQCDDPSLSYDAQETFGQEPYELYGEKQFQLEILKNGPVEGTLQLYSDFANYQSGIYQRTSTDHIGSHAVKILGWGVKDGIKYWLVANSWNERWGENGYFRIIRGQNDCGIESAIDAGLPDFSKF